MLRPTETTNPPGRLVDFKYVGFKYVTDPGVLQRARGGGEGDGEGEGRGRAKYAYPLTVFYLKKDRGAREFR